MMGLSFFLATALAIGSPGVAQDAPEDARIAAAAQAAGCAIEEEARSAAALATVPGQSDPMLFVVATLSGGPDDGSLGELCVSLVHDRGTRFVIVARLAGGPITPPNDVAPISNVYAIVPTTAFRFKPGEVAFGVEASGEYNSQATAVGFTTLYLFRRVGDRIVSIFHARTQDYLTNKTSRRGGERDVRWTVRFDTVSHYGAYDLLLQGLRGNQVRRYRWNGSSYMVARR